MFKRGFEIYKDLHFVLGPNLFNQPNPFLFVPLLPHPAILTRWSFSKHGVDIRALFSSEK
jgi:hypothetical protein